MAIPKLLQWLVDTAKTSQEVVKKNTEKKANKSLWWLIAVQKETMPQARAKALLPWLVKTAEVTGKIWQANVAKQQEQAKELLWGMTSTVKEWFTQAKDQALNDLQADVVSWMPKDDLRTYYPDIPANVVEDLYQDLQDGMPIEEAKKFYPEIYNLPTVEKKTPLNRVLWWVWKIASVVSPIAWAIQWVGTDKVISWWLWVLAWGAKVWSMIWKWVSYLDPTLSKEERDRMFSEEQRQKELQWLVWERAKTPEFWIWEKVWEFAGTTALTYPIWWWAGKLWILAKTAIWAWWWAIQTQLANIASEWKAATLWETALGASIGWVLGWASGLLSAAKKWLYWSAFSQTAQSTKKDLAKYWQTAWEAVLEQKLPPSIKAGITNIKDKLGNTWKAIEQTADQAWNIQGTAVKEWLKNDLIKKLWYDKLNQSAQSTKELITKVWSIVDDMIPDWVITPKEVVQQIKQINSTLPNTLLSKWFQDLKGNSKIQKVITTWLKDILDKAVESWGGSSWKIKELYAQYWKQKVVEKILEDESIRKILWRQLIGWVWWAGIWAVAWLEDFKQWDLLWWLGKVLAFSVVGTQSAKLAKDPDFLMRLWTAAEKLSKAEKPLRAWASILSSKINK